MPPPDRAASLSRRVGDLRITVTDRPPKYGERGWWIGTDETLEDGLDDLLENCDFELNSGWGWQTLPYPAKYESKDGLRPVTVSSEPYATIITTEVLVRLTIVHNSDVDAHEVINRVLDAGDFQEAIHDAAPHTDDGRELTIESATIADDECTVCGGVREGNTCCP